MEIEGRSVRRSLSIALVVFVVGSAALWTTKSRGEARSAPASKADAAVGPCPRGTLEERGLCIPVRRPTALR